MIRVAITENGAVRGLPAADPRITSFKGIPFAAPPIGKNRWRAPQPCENWEGIRNAYTFASISIQDTPGLGTDIYCREWNVDPDVPMSEDCLYLNVWTGAKHTQEKQPVMVWFFGGSFQWGYTSEMEFDGERIARRGVVVVSINYRLGALGFLSHPQLTQEQPEAPTNFGCLDQQAGLTWVARNIAAFGGDPDNITIAGQSAGGASVLFQMACKANEGLFHKAIVLSGMVRSPYNMYPLLIPIGIEESQKFGEKFFDALGVSDLEEARQLDPIYIRDVYAGFREKYPMMAPVVDGVFCVGDPVTLYMKNQCVPVPVLSGNTVDDFPNWIEAESEIELKEKANVLFGDKADTFLCFWETHRKVGATQYAPVNGIACTVKSAFLQSQTGGNQQPCYYYEFDVDIPGWDEPGTFHSVDLWFFFETLAKCWRPFTGKHYDISRQMCNYWTNFMKNGNPNGLDCDATQLPEWKTYTENEPCKMVFTSEGPKPTVHKPTAFSRFLMDEMSEKLKDK